MSSWPFLRCLPLVPSILSRKGTDIDVVIMDFMPTSPGARDPSSKKGTKLRSTCDACKDAKVRCNRETPSCYRCRNQKLKCVYNLSRRMGRPRRNRNDGESNDVGAEEEQDNAEKTTHHGNEIRMGETAQAESASCLNDSSAERAGEQGQRPSNIHCTHQGSHSTGSSSNDARLQDNSVISSLMDPFSNPDD